METSWSQTLYGRVQVPAESPGEAIGESEASVAVERDPTVLEIPELPRAAAVEWIQPKEEALCPVDGNWRNKAAQALWSLEDNIIIEFHVLDIELQDFGFALA